MLYNIIQVFNEPRGNDGWVSADDFARCPSLMPVSSYVKESGDRDLAARTFGQWLAEHGIGTLAGGSFTLSPDARKRYFEGRFPAFLKTLASLCAVTEDEFTNDHALMENLLSDLTLGISNKYSNYIMLPGQPPIPFDQFIRTAETGRPYYIGNILDCHY